MPDPTRCACSSPGHSDIEAAIAAVNEGQIFRFLSKPCPHPMLLAAIDAAVAQHRLITAERVLLEQTLNGSIKALLDVLSLTNPSCFGRATRIRNVARDVAQALDVPERWQVEVAAMLSQLGYITLPADTLDKVYHQRDLTEVERRMVARVPNITDELLANIPRLEVVREILSASSRPARTRVVPTDPRKVQVERHTQIFLVAMDFDALEADGSSAAHSIDTLRGRTGRYDPEVLDALAKVRAAGKVGDEVRELPLAGLRVGMVFANDVKTTSGTLLVARGYEITAGFIERIANFRPGAVREPVRVIVREAKETTL